MRVLLSIIFLILLSFSATASPFLVCDPQDGVASYLVSTDGCETFPGTKNAELDGSIKLDLEGYSPGTYYFCLRAVSVSGEISDPSQVLRETRHPSPSNLRFGERGKDEWLHLFSAILSRE
jgi:hypothetical protein